MHETGELLQIVRQLQKGMSEEEKEKSKLIVLEKKIIEYLIKQY